MQLREIKSLASTKHSILYHFILFKGQIFFGSVIRNFYRTLSQANGGMVLMKMLFDFFEKKTIFNRSKVSFAHIISSYYL